MVLRLAGFEMSKIGRLPQLIRRLLACPTGQKKGYNCREVVQHNYCGTTLITVSSPARQIQVSFLVDQSVDH
jgi:hypothetical protein